MSGWGSGGGKGGDNWSRGGGRSYDDRRREREWSSSGPQRHHGALDSVLTGKGDGPIRRVQIDALVVLQIMKHCKQNAPHPVTGVLLGLDVGDTMQVTHSFEKAREDDRGGDAAGGHDSEEHQVEMMRKLREVNVDTNTVGWYQTTHLGQFFSNTAIENQYHWQTENQRSVFLVYDSLQSAIGKPSFKALQLSPDFMKRFAETSETSRAAMADFPSHEMFMEVPIVISSSAIVEAFLIDWAISDPMFTSSNVPVLDVENQVFLEKNVQLLMSSLADLAEEQTKLVQFERQAARKDNAPQKGRDRFRQNQMQPRQLDTMILSQQIKNYCKAIDGFAADAFGKIFLMSNKPSGSGEAVGAA
jgi:translation initiation factor 3 subunit H